MKTLLAVAFLCLSSFASAAEGNGVVRVGKDFLIPGSVNGAFDQARKWSSPQICKVSKSLTCVVCAAGTASAPTEGILTAIEVSSGAIGGFVVALDTGAIPSAGREPASSGAGTQIASQRTCEYTLATTGLSGASCGVKEFDNGRPFTNGLVLCASTADVEVTATFYTQRK